MHPGQSNRDRLIEIARAEAFDRMREQVAICVEDKALLQSTVLAIIDQARTEIVGEG